jgi:alpha-tubulin suppressor-like RCC1 family protein
LSIESIGLKDVKEIYCGKDHNFAVKLNGKVLAWGYNESGQLGIGSDSTQFIPVEVRGLRGHRPISIRGGENFSLALTADRTVLAWGTNTYGQLGFGDTRERWTPEQIPSLCDVRSVDCGGNFSFAILADNKVLSWGMGMCYVLGHGDEADVLEPRTVEWFNDKSVRQLAAGAQHAVALL